MGGEVQVNRADEIIGTYEVLFFSLCEISEVDEAKLSVGDQRAKRAGILCGVHWRLRFACTKWIGLTGSFHRRSNMFAISGEHRHVDALDRNVITRLYNPMFRLGRNISVGGVQLA